MSRNEIRGVPRRQSQGASEKMKEGPWSRHPITSFTLKRMMQRRPTAGDCETIQLSEDCYLYILGVASAELFCPYQLLYPASLAP